MRKAELRGRKRITLAAVLVMAALLLILPMAPLQGPGEALAVGGTVTFQGHGKGHGVGMCMAGVYFRALRGEEYHNIIRTYYTGVGFSSVSDDMTLKVLCRDNVIRTYTLREYLYRLQEEPDSWPTQGLRVLMVAARTYTISCIARGKHAGQGYDICPYGSCCQAFNEQINPATRPNTVAAVNATAGEIITYGGQPIVAAYSSCCGGYTAGANEVWGGTGYPYWKPVPDDACAPDKNHDWVVTLTWEQLQAKLNANASTAVGTLYSFDILSRGVSGRVLNVRIDGSAGSKTVSGALFASVVGMETNFFYLGQSKQNFDEYLCIQNPGDADTKCTVTYMFQGGGTRDETFEVKAHSRCTICVNDRVSNAEVSIRVASEQPVVAERAMYFDFQAGKSDGHACMGVKQSSTRWYFAEGYTGGDFDTFITVQNPNPGEAHLQVSFLGNEGEVDVLRYTLNPTSRMTIWVNQEPGLDDTEFSAELVSDQPVVAERPVYFIYQGKGGGTCSEGMPQSGVKWYFSEGYTGGDFDTWIVLANPNGEVAKTTLTFMLPDTSTRQLELEVKPRSRATIHVDDLPGMGQTEFSTYVESSVPLVAERAMYFNYNRRDGGHDVVGIGEPSQRWYFAEGYTAAEFDTYFTLQNPASSSAEASLTFMLEDGSTAKHDLSIKPHSRYTVHVDNLPGMGQTSFSTLVDSKVPLVAERAMYFDYRSRSGGSCAQGTASPATLWYFAEGYTGS